MLEENGSKDLKFDMSGRCVRGANIVNKLEDIKLRLIISKAFDEKRDI